MNPLIQSLDRKFAGMMKEDEGQNRSIMGLAGVFILSLVVLVICGFIHLRRRLHRNKASPTLSGHGVRNGGGPQVYNIELAGLGNAGGVGLGAPVPKERNYGVVV